jgi:exonuclease SbcD
MRIIHTSDWHLGQYFFTKSRAAEHQSFLDWLIQQVEQHQVDALIVAGDIFDTGSPPSYARELYNRFVVALQKTSCQLIILGGNHDSVATLNESKQLLSCLNAQVFAAAESEAERQIVVLNQGQAPGAILCAVPFLRPRDITVSRSGLSATEKRQELQQAISQHYQQLYQRAIDLRERLNVSVPIIMTGHLTTVGVSASDAERDIYIGTLDAFPAACFPPVDYIALGHIHRAQCVAGQNHIRYSGSPIPLSFDELGADKSVFLLEFDQRSLTGVTTLTIPQFQPMRLIKGDLAEIERQLAAYQTIVTDRPVWLDIEVNSQDYLGDLQRTIQTLTAELPVEVILLRRSKDQRQTMMQRQDKETLAELTIDEVFQRRLALEDTIDDALNARLTQIFRQTVEEVSAQMENSAAQEQNRQRLLGE